MIHQSTFYGLASKAMEGCTMGKSFYEEARKTWLCSECGNPRGEGAINLTIQEQKLADNPLYVVSGCTVGIARKTFLNALGEEQVKHDLMLGLLFSEDAGLLDEWVTFIGRQRLIIRGTKHAAARICSSCGKQVYFAMGPHYLYPSPPEGFNIFDSGNGGIVVSEDLGRRIEQHGWKKLVCTKLPVLTVPKDGLGKLAA